jgi:hypothetical protein
MRREGTQATVSSMKKTRTWPEAIITGQEAFARAVLTRAQGGHVTDEDLNLLTASWHAAREHSPEARDAAGAHVELVVDIAVAVLLKRLDKGRHNQRGWLKSSRDEIVADARVWAFEQVNEYRPGTGSVLAYCASRADWAIGDLLRTHAQGSGAMDRRSYQVRSAAWAARAHLATAGNAAPTLEQLRAATLEQLVSDVCAKSKKVSTRDEAIAALRKDGRLGALDRLADLLAIGDADLCLQQPVDDGGTTIADTLSSSPAAEDQALAGDPDLGLAALYRVAVGDEDWAAPLLAARFGALGDVEGSGALSRDVDTDDEDGDDTNYTSSRGVSIPRLAEATGRDRDVIRDVLRCAPVRLSAPHAQWSHLANTVHAPVSAAPQSTKNSLESIDRSSFADA